MAGKAKDSYEYLHKGLKLGENAGNRKVSAMPAPGYPLPVVKWGVLTKALNMETGL